MTDLNSEWMEQGSTLSHQKAQWECPVCGKKGVVTGVVAPPLSPGPLRAR